MRAIKKKREVSCGFNKQRKNIISEDEGERERIINKGTIQIWW